MPTEVVLISGDESLLVDRAITAAVNRARKSEPETERRDAVASELTVSGSVVAKAWPPVPLATGGMVQVDGSHQRRDAPWQAAAAQIAADRLIREPWRAQHAARIGQQLRRDLHHPTQIGEADEDLGPRMTHEDTEEAGRTVRASKDDPQYLVKSEKSGGEAVHKPGALKKK